MMMCVLVFVIAKESFSLQLQRLEYTVRKQQRSAVL